MQETPRSKNAAHARAYPPHLIGLLLATLCCAALPCAVRAQGAAGRSKPQPPPGVAQGAATAKDGAQAAAQKYFTDVELLNQNGEKMRFYSDLLKDKVVVVNTFF